MENDFASLNEYYQIAEEARAEVLQYVKRYDPTYYVNLETVDIRKLVRFIDESEWPTVWRQLNCVGNAMSAEAVTSERSLSPQGEAKQVLPSGPSTAPRKNNNMMATLVKRAALERKSQGGVSAPEAPLNRTIYVRKCYHTKGTLVHEMLHWLTHKDFQLRFTLNKQLDHVPGYKDALIEGTTEHITRKILKVKHVRTDVNGKNNFYGPEYDKMKALSKALKEKPIPNPESIQVSTSAPPVDVKIENLLAKAYFKGDPQALHMVEIMFPTLKL